MHVCMYIICMHVSVNLRQTFVLRAFGAFTEFQKPSRVQVQPSGRQLKDPYKLAMGTQKVLKVG